MRIGPGETLKGDHWPPFRQFAQAYAFLSMKLDVVNSDGACLQVTAPMAHPATLQTITFVQAELRSGVVGFLRHKKGSEYQTPEPFSGCGLQKKGSP